MIKSEYVIADVEEQTAYLLNGMLFVPHYTNKGVFVAPGSITYLESALVNIAQKVRLMLWPREYKRKSNP